MKRLTKKMLVMLPKLYWGGLPAHDGVSYMRFTCPFTPPGAVPCAACILDQPSLFTAGASAHCWRLCSSVEGAHPAQPAYTTAWPLHLYVLSAGHAWKGPVSRVSLQMGKSNQQCSHCLSAN